MWTPENRKLYDRSDLRYGPHRPFTIQSLHPLELHGCLRPDSRKPCQRGRSARATHHRFHLSQSPQDGSQPSRKGALPRCLRRAKGGLYSKLHAVTDQDRVLKAQAEYYSPARLFVSVRLLWAGPAGSSGLCGTAYYFGSAIRTPRTSLRAGARGHHNDLCRRAFHRSIRLGGRVWHQAGQAIPRQSRM